VKPKRYSSPARFCLPDGICSLPSGPINAPFTSRQLPTGVHHHSLPLLPDSFSLAAQRGT
jgi:hypothetical protein